MNQPLSSPDSHDARRIAWVIGASAAMLLLFELALTRLCSLRYQFHFGYAVVTNGMLGIGASGVVVAAFAAKWRGQVNRVLRGACRAQLFSVLIAWAVALLLPVHQGQMGASGTVSLIGFNLLSGLPFFFCGGTIGLALAAHPARLHRLYMVDLVCAGLACALFPALVSALGVGGVLALALALGLVAMAAMGDKLAVVPALIALGLSPVIDGALPAPSKLERPLLASWWTDTSRVDLAEISADKRTQRSSGKVIDPAQLPAQLELFQDGTASTPLVDFSGQPQALQWLSESTYGAAVSLLENPRVFIVGAGGGNDVWAAVAGGAKEIAAVELNQPILAMHQSHAYSATLRQNPTIEWVHAEGRSALSRAKAGRWDLVQLSGIDTWAALTSGAYVLAENYLYTTQAISQMLRLLAEGGIVQITRMALEMENTRLLSIERAALAQTHPEADFAQSVAVLGTVDFQAATLLKPDGFSTAEVEKLADQCARTGLVPLYLPGKPDQDGYAAQFITSADPDAFIAQATRDLSPTTDDRPYFFHFTRWRAAQAAQTVREPTYISQGNPLFIVAQLSFAFVMSGLALTLAARRSRQQSLALLPRQSVLYFCGVGAAFVATELVLIQKLTLPVGHPATATAVTLGALLTSAGIGARLSQHWSFDRVRWVVTGTLGVLAVALVAGDAALFDWTLHLPGGARAAVAWLICVPFGLVMGMPFPTGMRLITDTSSEEMGQTHIGWAWAWNGFATVIGALCTVVASIGLGFDRTLLVAIVVYALTLSRAPRS